MLWAWGHWPVELLVGLGHPSCIRAHHLVAAAVGASGARPHQGPCLLSYAIFLGP